MNRGGSVRKEKNETEVSKGNGCSDEDAIVEAADIIPYTLGV